MRTLGFHPALVPRPELQATHGVRIEDCHHSDVLVGVESWRRVVGMPLRIVEKRRIGEGCLHGLGKYIRIHADGAGQYCRYTVGNGVHRRPPRSHHGWQLWHVFGPPVRPI